MLVTVAVAALVVALLSVGIDALLLLGAVPHTCGEAGNGTNRLALMMSFLVTAKWPLSTGSQKDRGRGLMDCGEFSSAHC